MGGNTSSLHRLRNRYIISLCNAGFDNNTLHQIFEPVASEKGGKRVISRSDLLYFFGRDAAALVDELICQCNFQYDSIPLSFVLGFLESGTFSKDMIQSARDGCKNQGLYPEVLKKLNFQILPNASVMVPYACDSRNYKGETENKMSTTVWKKHETIIQEKIVKHVTIESDGTVHELVERDKSQNEVIHMECKLTGTLAHREYSQQEQTEELDKEPATFVRATEEYVHFKSIDDEYEYLHSNIPLNKSNAENYSADNENEELNETNLDGESFLPNEPERGDASCSLSY